MSTSNHIQSLNAVRLGALQDPQQYDGLLGSILPLLAASAPLDLKRWTADFISETFANQSLHPDKKQSLAIKVLPQLRDTFEDEEQDRAVVKSLVQAATCIYPLIFSYIIKNGNDSATWQHMVAIKSNILQRMDRVALNVRICCIKFVQRVIQAQTPGLIADPRQRSEQSELSLSLVPRDHPLLLPPNLEAEAHGLLDRLLNVFQDGQPEPNDALLVTSTLNSIGVLVRTRGSLSGRIVTAVLNFNPTRWSRLDTPAARVVAKSVERTVRAFLKNFQARSGAQGTAFGGRIQGYLDRLAHPVEEQSRKRAAPSEPNDGLDQAKRQRLGAEVTQPPPPLPDGPLSLAEVFTLATDPATRGFHVNNVPFDYVPNIVAGLLKTIDQTKLNSAINVIRQRLLELSERNRNIAPLQQDFYPGAEMVQPPLPLPDPDATDELLNQMQAAPAAEEPAFDESLAAFELPVPPPLSAEEVDEFGTELVERLMTILQTSSNLPVSKGPRGLKRAAGSLSDRDYWTTIAVRLATRPVTGLASDEAYTANIGSGEAPVTTSISRAIRQYLFKWIMTDQWQHNLDTAVQWLNEEWFSDLLQRQRGIQSNNYEIWSSRILSSICAYIDASDMKYLIRFVSEVPRLSNEDLDRIKRLAEDPERIQMVIRTFMYLIMFKPPVKEKSLDLVEELYRDYPEAKREASKCLKKFRPLSLRRLEEAEGRVDLIKKESPADAEEVKVQEDQSKPDMGTQNTVIAAG